MTAHRLSVSSNGRHLLRHDGTPFFYLGDTAWELFNRLDLDEAKHFLAVRARQKFTAIQAVLLAEFDGLRAGNAYGEKPFHDLNPYTPNEAYFRHCDRIVEETARHGIYSAILPTWGDKWNKGWGAGPEIFDPESAFSYGQYVGARYRDFPVIWVLGGDRSLSEARHLETVRAMARGIRSVSPDQLMTLHPPGGNSSAVYAHGEDWLDFNMLQSGHTGQDNPGARMVEYDLARRPAKPCLDGEPNYEDHPVMKIDNGWKPTGDWFDDFPCRKQAWRPLLAGACGHTYGCHDVWQMWDTKRTVVNEVRTPWPKAIELPGANQMQHLRSFFEGIPWLLLVADQSLLGAAVGDTPATQARSARATDGSYGVVYLPTPRSVTPDLRRLKPNLKATWYDPRTAERTPAGDAKDGVSFTSPDARDWVLHLHE